MATSITTAPQIVADINALTQKSQNLQAPANSINLLSGPLFLIGQGPFTQIVIGFTEIITQGTVYMSAMAGTQPFSVKSDEDTILDAFTTFVKVHQQLLNTLIGKAGVLNDLPLVGPPVSQVLRSHEAVLDSISFRFLALAPDVSAAMTAQKNSLDDTISKAITAYTPIV